MAREKLSKPRSEDVVLDVSLAKALDLPLPPAGEWRDFAPSAPKKDNLVLLWELAEEMARAEGHEPVTLDEFVARRGKHWVQLMDAIWRGELAADGLVLLSNSAPGLAADRLDRPTLAAALLGTKPGGHELRATVESLIGWRLEDYRNQPCDHAYIFKRDREGRLGLAIDRGEFERWRARQIRINPPSEMPIHEGSATTEPVENKKQSFFRWMEEQREVRGRYPGRTPDKHGQDGWDAWRVREKIRRPIVAKWVKERNLAERPGAPSKTRPNNSTES